MRLYFKPGACSLASRIVLIELGRDFEAIRVDTETGLTEDGHDFSAVNPRGYVPALQLADGRTLTENTAILQFLGDLEPGTLTPPAASWGRVRLQEILSFLSSELHKAFSPFFRGEAVGEARAPALSLLERKIGELEAMLPSEAPFFLCGDLSVADIYLFVILSWADFIGVDLSEWPRISRFMDLLRERESVRLALAQEGRLRATA